MLHGALGDKTQFDPIIPGLKDHFDLHLLNFEGHGDAGPTDSPFHIEYFIENVLGYLDEHEIPQTNIFGYSMGGYVGLNLAKQQPVSIGKIATLGTILQWDEEVAQQECRHLHPREIKEKVPHFARQLSERHLSGWERVVDETRAMLEDLGANPLLDEEDWNHITHRVRLHVGDRDTTSAIDKTVEIYKKMDYAELAVLPRTAHPISEVNIEVLVASLLNFFKGVNKPAANSKPPKNNGNGNGREGY